MKNLLSVLLLSVVCSPDARASALFDDLVRSNPVLRAFFGDGECAERPAPLPDASAEALFKRGQSSTAKKNHCEAARSYFEVMRQHPIAPWWKKSWLALIDSYVAAGDTLMAANEANEFLDQMRGVPEAEVVHFKLLTAVHQRSRALGAERSQEWTEYALGISRAQSEKNPYLLRLSYQSYLETYPHGRFVAEVRAYQLEARNIFANHWLAIGKFYLGQRQYVAAIERFRFILQWGPGVAAFDEALFRSIETLANFARDIADRRRLSDDRLEELARAPLKSIDRASLAAQTRAEAERLLRTMETDRPASPWLAQARAALR